MTVGRVVEGRGKLKYKFKKIYEIYDENTYVFNLQFFYFNEKSVMSINNKLRQFSYY